MYDYLKSGRSLFCIFLFPLSSYYQIIRIKLLHWTYLSCNLLGRSYNQYDTKNTRSKEIFCIFSTNSISYSQISFSIKGLTLLWLRCDSSNLNISLAAYNSYVFVTIIIRLLWNTATYTAFLNLITRST